MAFAKQNLAHFYSQEGGDPGWGQKQRWQMAGATRSISTHDADFGKSDENVNRAVSGGFFRQMFRLGLTNPTVTRVGRVGAQLDSLPNAPFFQGYTGAGTGQGWSGGAVAQGQRMLNKNNNPNMPGKLEMQPAMTYDPFPSPSSLYPKVV